MFITFTKAKCTVVHENNMILFLSLDWGYIRRGCSASTFSKAVVFVIVRIDCCTSAIEFNRRCAAWHLRIHTLEELNKLGIVQFPRQLTHLCHSADHSFNHLGFLRFTDFQRIHCKNEEEEMSINLQLPAMEGIQIENLRRARASWSMIWLKIEFFASSCWRTRSCWIFCCSPASLLLPPCESDHRMKN